MFFPLLESLLKKDAESSKGLVRGFFHTEEDLAPLFKSVLTFSSQHATDDTANMDAVVVSTNIINVLQNRDVDLTPSQKETVIGYGIDYLCRIPVEAVDTSALKPAREKAKVVSISDVEESFDTKDINAVIIAVRDLLSLMDNKNYFMEIMYRIALRRTMQSVILAVATGRAIETLGWQNNFTPFLIYHLVSKMLYDLNRYEYTGPYNNEGGLFEKSLSYIESVADAQFISALFRMNSESKILGNKIKPLILMRLNGFFRDKEITNNFSARSFSPIERIAFHSCLEDLKSIPGSEQLRQKIPFVV